MNFDPITRPYSGDAHRAMSDQREAYFAQSAMTRNGEVAEFARAALTGDPAQLIQRREK